MIVDITPLISSRIAVFPGDCAFSRKVTVSMEGGSGFRLSEIHSTLHLGAHADATNHYHQGGEGVERRNLSAYIGPAQVIHVLKGPRHRIVPEDFAGIAIRAPRVLFRTGTFSNPDLWNSDFSAFSPEVIDFLADQGVMLVGIDTPSVDLCDDASLLAHARIYARGLSNLEGLTLENVKPGLYGLVALPLPIEGADASPVRAVLLPNPAEVFQA